MLCDMMQELENNPFEILKKAQFLQAYLECSDDLQEHARELLKVVGDADVDKDDRLMTLHTLADLLLPNKHEGVLGMDLEESEKMGSEHSDETRQCIEEMDREEAEFADRLTSIMKERGLTQMKLAELTKVTQPAISNMLNRQCRPQRATILKLATALDIDPAVLWPVEPV